MIMDDVAYISSSREVIYSFEKVGHKSCYAIKAML